MESHHTITDSQGFMSGYAENNNLIESLHGLKRKFRKVDTFYSGEERPKLQTSEEYDQSALEFASAIQELIKEEKLLLGAKSQDHIGEKVIEFQHPASLKKLLQLTISPEGDTNEDLMSICQDVVKYSMRTGSSCYFNQLCHGGDPYGIAAAWLTEALNASEYTYEVAPVFVIVSDYIINRISKMAGYKNGDGIFVPGGSMGNIMALSLARYNYSADLKTQGLFGSKRLLIFISEQSHFSTAKGAALLGFGTDSMILVKSDDRGRMLISDLRLKIQQEKAKGNVPLTVFATSGTTVLGAFDDLNEIADVCEENKLWMHVDSCWGGSVLFTPTHRHLMKGVERSDSFCISLHKMMGAPIQCVPLITKQKGILQNTFGFGASYLFQKDKFYDMSFDMGDKTIQCGRKADALKFWLMWKARGDMGMAAHVDAAFYNAQSLKEKLENREGFRLIMPEFDYTNIGFWYIPASLRGKPETEEWWQQLHKVAPVIKERMQRKGSLMIGYQPLSNKNFVNFFRIIIISSRLRDEHLEHVLDEIDSLGKDL